MQENTRASEALAARAWEDGYKLYVAEHAGDEHIPTWDEFKAILQRHGARYVK